MKKLVREYWFNIAWSLCMVGIGIGITVEYGIEVGFFAYGLAFAMSIPIFFAVYDKVKGKH